MAGQQPSRGGRSDFDEFVARTQREIEDLRRHGEATTRDAVGKATRYVRDLSQGEPSPGLAYGSLFGGESFRGQRQAQNRPLRNPTGAPPHSTQGVARRPSASPSFSQQAWEAALQADTAVRAAANTLTFGGADHLAAGADALLEPGDLSDWHQRYQANLAREQARNAYDAEHRSAAQAVGNLAGTGLGLFAMGPMEGAPAAASRLAGAAKLTGRELAAILAAGGATGLGVNMVSDAATGHTSTLGDKLGAVVGGVAGAGAAVTMGPARSGAIGASVTSAAQDYFNGRPISLQGAGESALGGNLLGGGWGMVGRVASNALAPVLKGKLGEAMGSARSMINGLDREVGPKGRETIGDSRRYWYPDGRSGDVRFEDKFGEGATLSPNQALARDRLGPNFLLYHFLPSDVGRILGMPAAAVAPHMVETQDDER